MSARERLARRGLPQTTYPILAVPIDEVGTARAVVDEARRAFLAAEARGVTELDPYRAAERDARAALNLCYEEATLKALPQTVMERLLEEHLPTQEQAEKQLRWNPGTFIPALLALAVSFADGERWTVDEWAEWTATGANSPLALGEVSLLFDTAYGLNTRPLDLRMGKG